VILIEYDIAGVLQGLAKGHLQYLTGFCYSTGTVNAITGGIPAYIIHDQSIQLRYYDSS